MTGKKPYKRQYLWVSQDFYNWIMNTSKKTRERGVETGSAVLTHKLIHDVRLPEKINFNFDTKSKWRRRKK